MVIMHILGLLWQVVRRCAELQRFVFILQRRVTAPFMDSQKWQRENSHDLSYGIRCKALWWSDFEAWHFGSPLTYRIIWHYFKFHVCLSTRKEPNVILLAWIWSPRPSGGARQYPRSRYFVVNAEMELQCAVSYTLINKKVNTLSKEKFPKI